MLFAIKCVSTNSDIKGQLHIPEYQRPYIWGKKQINRLLDDFIEYQKNDGTEKCLFYLGSIILHQDGKKLKIIDGQQRITTLLLMYAFHNPKFKSKIEYESAISIENIKRNYLYLKSVAGKEVFEYSEYDVLNKIDLTEINITLIIAANEDLAYNFFETQNTGGVRLSGSDIIKAHHLRAVPSRKIINYQARKWESIKSEKVERIIQSLTKIRFWDNRKWRRFPFYKDEKGIKSVLIDEFTENTKHDTEDISFYYSAVKNIDGQRYQLHESHYKQLKQPLSDGNNTLDYINDYIQLHDILFNTETKDYRISDNFYDFHERLVHGCDGTLFLKELLEISIVVYVSRFGFQRLFEVSLWLYRAIYSLRVSSSRNVREDSIFKFVYDNQFIDNIIEVFTIDELVLFLKKFKYEFNTNYLGTGQSKAKHLTSLAAYFDNAVSSTESYQKDAKVFDKDLWTAIVNKINSHKDEQ